MPSSTLISGWGNGGWGQTSYGIDLLQMYVDGVQADSAVGTVTVVPEIFAYPTGVQADTALGMVTATTGATAVITGFGLTAAVGTVQVREEIEVFVYPVGVSMVARVGRPTVWEVIDDSQNAVWQPINTGSAVWADVAT